MAEHLREAASSDGWSDLTAFLAATSRADIHKLTVDQLQRYGLQYVTIWSWRENSTSVAQGIDLNTRPAFVTNRYIRDMAYLRDPVVLAMGRMSCTLTWSQVMSQYIWSKEERAVVESARDFGATDGVIAPIFSSRGISGVFSVCGSKPDLSPAALWTVGLIGQSAHQGLMRLSEIERRRHGRHIVLNPRENEAINGMARHKTDGEIAADAGTKTVTVKALLSGAQRKLGVSTRNEIIVRELLAGELRLDAPGAKGRR